MKTKKLIFLSLLLIMVMTACSVDPAGLSGAAGANRIGSNKDSVTFVNDVTIPDFSYIAPGDSFTKTWRLLNSGEATWTKDYKVVYFDGYRMDAEESISLPRDVPPGETIDISIKFTAPKENGQYASYWMLKNEDGNLFGLGPAQDIPFYLVINVSGGESHSSGGSTEELQINGSVLYVNQPAYRGECPVTLNFSGAIYSAGAGEMKYELETQSETSGFSFYLPETYTMVYQDGKDHKLDVAYALQINSSVEGWARLHISKPGDIHSEKVNFSVICQ